jgi:hypothetical protein
MPDEFAGLPELTLSLRSLGSGRGAAPAEQGRFFAPLLEARRRAATATSVPEVLAAFSVARLAAALEETLRSLASERFPNRPPARRAFEAELVDAAQPLFAALRTLRDSSPPTNAPVSDQGWKRWLDMLRATFESADRAWRAIDVSLARVPLTSKSAAKSKKKGKGAQQ